MIVDYHCHTNYSADSHATMTDQCLAAVHKGVKQIAYTEHEDYNPRDSVSFFFKHADYIASIQRHRAQFDGELVIRAGIEISEPHRHPQRVSDVLGAQPWDFVLASMHWMNDGTVNASKEGFVKHSGDWRQSFRSYFTEMAAMARDGDYDVLAHIDYPSRYNRSTYDGEYNIAEYEDEIRAVLQQVITRGKGIEINTSPWRRGLPDPNPPAMVVRWFREMGGEVLTVGSDSHAPKDVGANIDRALDIAREAGFSHIATFEQRRPAFVPLLH